MRFNYGLERKRFESHWRKLQDEYRAAGMSNENIEKMKCFDWEMLKRERLYCDRIEYLLPDMDRLEECIENYCVLNQTISLTENGGIYVESSISWIETIDSKELYQLIDALKESEKELLTMLAFDEYSSEEIAKMKGVSRQAVSKRIHKLKKKIQKFL